MTVSTIAEKDTPEFLEDFAAYSYLFVTFNTFNILVASDEPELCS
jgi:hypothetical protein